MATAARLPGRGAAQRRRNVTAAVMRSVTSTAPENSNGANAFLTSGSRMSIVKEPSPARSIAAPSKESQLPVKAYWALKSASLAQNNRIAI